ncbi:MAG: hypothetical protein ACM3U0_00325 [archaeon]
MDMLQSDSERKFFRKVRYAIIIIIIIIGVVFLGYYLFTVYQDHNIVQCDEERMGNIQADEELGNGVDDSFAKQKEILANEGWKAIYEDGESISFCNSKDFCTIKRVNGIVVGLTFVLTTIYKIPKHLENITVDNSFDDFAVVFTSNDMPYRKYFYLKSSRGFLKGKEVFRINHTLSEDGRFSPVRDGSLIDKALKKLLPG